MCLLSIRFDLFAANNECKTFRRANMLTCFVQYSIRKLLMPLPPIFNKSVG